VALKPIFKAAEAFPGIVTFELQFGLALIPLMPRTRNTSMISSTEWSEIFQPRNGTPKPTTKFVNRLTACGSEIDHIIDLRKPKAQGKSRIFEEEYASIISAMNFIVALTQTGCSLSSLTSREVFPFRTRSHL
jgi:hypothetical protein